WGAACAGEYRQLAPSLLPRVLAAFARLAEAADLVLIEGAGSPAEINLRDGDIAQLVGTHELLSASEKALLAGYVVNKFRGDIRLFDGGITALGERTGLRCFGVVPHFAGAANLPAEDSLALALHPLPASGEGEGPAKRQGEGRRPVRIAVPVFPRIANFDD